MVLLNALEPHGTASMFTLPLWEVPRKMKNALRYCSFGDTFMLISLVSLKHQVAIPSEFYGSSYISLLHCLLPPFSFIFMSLAYLNSQTICFTASTIFFFWMQYTWWPVQLRYHHRLMLATTLFMLPATFCWLCRAPEATSCSSRASFDMALTIDPKFFEQQNSQWAHFVLCPLATRNENINCCATCQQSWTPSGGVALNFANCSSCLVEWWPT